MCLSDIDVRALLQLEPVRLKVTPDPETAAALEEKRAQVIVPEKAQLLRDQVQDRLPNILRRQAG